jgi:hypothetical protein
MNKLKAFTLAREDIKMQERDRKAEWRGLSRISCLINAFADNKVEDKEIDACKMAGHDTSFFIIVYPKVPKMTKCVVTKLYPATGAYKRAEFAPLPTLAKGKISVPCSGVEEIPTKPRKGSPKTCKCRRVTLEGHYRAGPLVKCTNCHDVRRSKDRNSCPRGTKIFSPSSRADWRTFLGSATPLAHPNWIVDITRPQNGCGGCTSNAMNWQNKNQKSWRTSDGSPWWLRSTKFKEPSGDYSANCFMDLGKKKFGNEDSVTFNDKSCNYHSKSYYCQKVRLYLKPRKGSPESCKCQPVTLGTKYSPGMLVKCEQCLDVYRSAQKNSCPHGMKIFSPRSRADWRTFLESAQPLRAPNFIIDITRPQNGCGGCTKYPMNSKVPNQATWKTSDGSAWWLRSTKYTQPNGPVERPFGDAGPNGDYTANCFMDLWRRPSNENSIQFNDRKCVYHSRSYYCQPNKPKPKPPAPPPPPVPKRIVPFSMLKKGLKEEIYSFKQGKKVPTWRRDLCAGKSSNILRPVKAVNYKKSKKAWPGYGAFKDDFAVRWSGFLLVKTTGKYTFLIKSDDGSKLELDNKMIINNDGLHAIRARTAERKLQFGQHFLSLEYFEKGGDAAMQLLWKGKSLGRGFKVISRKYLGYVPEGGFKEEIYYINGLSKVPNLNRKPATQRVVKEVVYKKTEAAWKGFAKKDNFACRWSGQITIQKKGTYRFSLISDDGSKLYINGKLKLDNDGLHGLRKVEGTVPMKVGKFNLILEYFEKSGHHGMAFRYMGPDTESKMVPVSYRVTTARYAKTLTPIPKNKTKVVPKKTAPKPKKKPAPAPPPTEDEEEEEF